MRWAFFIYDLFYFSRNFGNVSLLLLIAQSVRSLDDPNMIFTDEK
jgi:hypothetical protein